MAQKIFTTMVSLENYIESACEKAVENACNRLLGTLQELIDSEYYDQFTPEKYKRTYQFWKSATTRMLDKNCGEIFMDADAMDYGSFWNGELQLLYASEGYHGSKEIQTEGRFWDEFLNFCKHNAVRILKEELNKQGIRTS